jgi:hypothetical protein
MRRKVAKSKRKGGRCPTGKVRYRDHASATAALRYKAPGREVTPVRAYPCPRCNGWHTTSKAR